MQSSIETVILQFAYGACRRIVVAVPTQGRVAMWNSTATMKWTGEMRCNSIISTGTAESSYIIALSDTSHTQK
jgi:hypothetical protein